MAKAEVTVSYLVMILIALITGTLIILFVIGIAPIASTEVVDTVCKGSVATRSADAVRLGIGDTVVGEVSPLPLLCSTAQKDLPEEKKKASIFLKKSKKEKSLELQRQLAEHIAGCWDTFGRGKFNPLFAAARYTDAKEGKCFTCYDFSLDQPLNVDSFYTEFLTQETYIANEEKDKEFTYAEFITKSGGCGYLHLPTKINAVERYGIMFIGPKSSTEFLTDLYDQNKEGTLAGGYVGAKAGLLATSWVPIPGARLVGGVGGFLIGGYYGAKSQESTSSTITDFFAYYFPSIRNGESPLLKESCAGIMVAPIRDISQECLFPQLPAGVT
jgi:hypothetical protein